MIPRHFDGQNSVSVQLRTKSIEHNTLFSMVLQNSYFGRNNDLVRLVRILSGFRPAFSPPPDEMVLSVWAGHARRFWRFEYSQPVPIHR
jgi:hypothetical protein